MDYPIVLGSAEELRNIPEKGIRYFVWENEFESFNPETGKVVFNDEAKSYGTQPLLIDAYTASAAIKVMDAVKPETLERIEKRIQKDRAYFAQFIEKVWTCIK